MMGTSSKHDQFIKYIFFQVFVETLDKTFENVCELDLIFHVDKVSVQPVWSYFWTCTGHTLLCEQTQ